MDSEYTVGDLCDSQVYYHARQRQRLMTFDFIQPRHQTDHRVECLDCGDISIPILFSMMLTGILRVSATQKNTPSPKWKRGLKVTREKLLPRLRHFFDHLHGFFVLKAAAVNHPQHHDQQRDHHQLHADDAFAVFGAGLHRHNQRRGD